MSEKSENIELDRNALPKETTAAEADEEGVGPKQASDAVRKKDSAARNDIKARDAVLNSARLLPSGKMDELKAQLAKLSPASSVLAGLSMIPSINSEGLKARLESISSVNLELSALKLLPSVQLEGLKARMERLGSASSLLAGESIWPTEQLDSLRARLRKLSAAGPVLTGLINLPTAGVEGLRAQVKASSAARLALGNISAALPVARLENFTNVRMLGIAKPVGVKAFLALAGVDDETWSEIISNLESSPADLDLSEIDSPDAAASVEAEVVTALDSGSGLAGLSSSASKWLVYLFWVYMGVLNYLAMQNGVREELCFLQPKLAPGLTMGQTAKAIRAAVCESQHSAEILKKFRIVKGENVRLRSEPSMKAEVVQVNLEDRDSLEVLDSSNRDWLYVSLVSEEGVTGWISRKYTHPLHK